MKNFISERVSELEKLLINPDSFPATRLSELGELFLKVFQSKNSVFFVGNGGSAAEAMHLAAEFTGRCIIDHPPLSAFCLNESQSSLTAISNDYGNEFIFSRLVQAHVKEGDLLIALSTSGKSENILNAITSAKNQFAQVVLWTGINAPNIEGVDIWRVPSNSTPRIQEIHLSWGHLVAEYVETSISSQS
jgi:D-sedoheptulose 7-phosphate isomerase